MKTINTCIIISIFIFAGLQKAAAQTRKAGNKTEVEQKGKVNEHTELAPVKEVEVNKEPSEVLPVTEHRESSPVKEQEVPTGSQPAGVGSAPNTLSEKKEAPVNSSPHPHRNLSTLPVRKGTLTNSKPIVIDAEKK